MCPPAIVTASLRGHVDRLLTIVAAVDDLAPIGAIGDPGQVRSHPALGGVEQELEVGRELLDAVIRLEILEPCPTGPAGSDRSLEVAQHEMGQSRVGVDQVPHVGADLAAVMEPQRGNAEVLLPDVGGLRVVSTHDRTA